MPPVHGSIYEFETLPNFGERPNRAPVQRRETRARLARERSVPLVGIVRNPRSHRNKNVAAEMEDCSNILTETPRTRAQLYDVMQMFARRGIDYLVVDGGDGTVRDVLSCGADVFGDAWPTLVVLPKGKTNALTVDLGLPTTWSLGEALVAAKRGKRVTRRPLRISNVDGSGSVQGFILGAGVFSLATEAGQEAHRRGAFNSFAVGLSILWCIIQSLFGGVGNPWRQGTRTRLVDRLTGLALPRTGPGDPAERYLTIATTFERFPLGIKPFGRNPAAGLKLAVMDSPVRWMVALLPAVILFGLGGRFLERRGIHRIEADEVEMDIDNAFVLDGEAFPAGSYILDEGPELSFVVP